MNWDNPEERREYQRKYREVKKEKLKEQRKARYLKKKQEYYETHKEEIEQRKKEKAKMTRARKLVSLYCRSDKHSNRGNCTLTDKWVADNIFSKSCYYCGETDWHKLGCDRINNDLPHTPDNVVCSCRRCNNKRGTIPFDEFIKRLKDGEPLLMKNRPDKSKAVVAKDAEENIVYKFPSAMEAERSGFNAGGVSCACRKRFNRPGNNKYKRLYWYWV